MNEPEVIREDLETFFSDDEALIAEAPEKEKQINDEEEKLYSNSDAAVPRSCARVRYGSSCGFANSGQSVYVVNARNDKRIQATIRVSWSNGIDNGQYDRVHVIPAGSEKRLGCTRSSHIPVTDYRYSVVGCEVL
ncbi:hypothetical protein K1B30_003875 [Vibrio parahaemolyticus]|nr:hypothetical protein [Vibrio parahaemolyticus]EIU6803295.1 hypothetical protein [Vibrio parahaemolyticus]